MKEIIIKIGTSEKSYTVPDSWNELTDEQFLFCIKHYPREDKTPIAIMRHLIGPDVEADFLMLPIHWNAIYEQSFQWLRSFSGLRVWQPGSIILSDGRECRPPLPDFSNVEWIEFVFADTLAQQGNWAGVAACLYRPLFAGATEDEDCRVFFGAYGTNARLGLFQKQDKAVLAAVEISYSTLKSRLAARYPNLFSISNTAKGGKPVSWMEVTHTVLGDDVWHERDLHTTSAVEVLAFLDGKIKESKK